MHKRILTVLILLVVVPFASAADRVVLENDFLRVELGQAAGTWRNTRIARVDGSDALKLDNDEFEILLFDGSRFTVDDYRAKAVDHEAGTFTVIYEREAAAIKAPATVTVTYALGAGPYLHKDVRLGMQKGEKIDRLQVLRFSCGEKASRGGEGQPVFIGNWFFGVDYPGFYSRHSDGFAEPNFRYKWHYTIDFEGRDKEFAPRKGFVSCFHFPGYAKERADGSWGITGKRAVMGLSRKKGESAELALIDYIDETRLPPRSYLHFNNWYSAKAKNLAIPVFVDDVAATIQRHMKAHGANLDGMVPDHGWQNGKTFSRIFEPKEGLDLAALQAALERIGVGLGLWMAIDGTNNGHSRGREVGYKPAYTDGFDRSQFKWMAGNKVYFDILDPRYQRDLRESLRHMIVDGKINYIKHDFNHNFTSAYLSQRHAREACLDVTLELLAYERELNPRIFQNYTNGAWFSPWWFQHAHVIWMMSGDSGGNGSWPQLSLRDGATAYRDSWLHQSFNSPDRCVRPLIRIADLMTHGILLTKKKPFTDFKDTLYDWSNYVVMYYARGTTLKELYIDNELLDDDHWKVLGMASAWAQAYQDRLLNTVLIGGDCGVGEIYGYVSWVGDKAILTARNPDRRTQTLTVPFDASVYYRGEPGQRYHARAIYPFVEEMPWTLTSGQAFTVDIPGDSILMLDITPGGPKSEQAVMPGPLPEASAEIHEDSFTASVAVPDEDMLRYDLLVQAWGSAVPKLSANDQGFEPRLQDGGRWTLSAYDLRQYRGKTLTLRGRLVPSPNANTRSKGKKPYELWIVADRPVPAPVTTAKETLPFPISQNQRRQTMRLTPR